MYTYMYIYIYILTRIQIYTYVAVHDAPPHARGLGRAPLVLRALAEGVLEAPIYIISYYIILCDSRLC